ncbi:hypothetical protein C8R43DRAFT_903886, partial [Mycena crocata]
DQFAIKSILQQSCDGSVVDATKRLSHEVQMTLLAGTDCALPIVGRYYPLGHIVGFVTPFGRYPDSVIRPEVHAQRIPIIHQFVTLIDTLHSKGIVHGDVKPSNLVLDTGGNLRFLDFAEAVQEGVSTSQALNRTITVEYISPSAWCRGPLYVAGVTVWHIYTGN